MFRSSHVDIVYMPMNTCSPFRTVITAQNNFVISTDLIGTSADTIFEVPEPVHCMRLLTLQIELISSAQKDALRVQPPLRGRERVLGES